MKEKYVVVFVTAPKKSCKKIISHILNKKLVACINEVRGVQSFYWWEKKICNDEENLLIMKTTSKLVEVLITEIKKVHPYQVPEIISIPILKGNKEYLNWVSETVNKTQKN